MTALFIVIGLILFITWFFRQPAVKGKCGELLVAYCLSKLDKEKYQVFNNVMIPDNAGGTTQIDHIVLSSYGIFVVETKNMKGWIFGDRNSDKWMQQIFKCKNQFQNPFRQNYKHIKCLADLTGLSAEYFIHTIVFVGDCTIKTRAQLPEALVENATQLFRFISSYDQEVLDGDTLETVKSAIIDNCMVNNYANKKQHIQYVKQIVENKNTAALDDDYPEPPAADVAPVCPKCGSAMVQRKAKRGENAGKTFWGCSNYPACRYIINE